MSAVLLPLAMRSGICGVNTIFHPSTGPLELAIVLVARPQGWW